MTIAFRRGRVINPIVTADLPDPSKSVFGPVAAGLMGPRLPYDYATPLERIRAHCNSKHPEPVWEAPDPVSSAFLAVSAACDPVLFTELAEPIHFKTNNEAAAS